MIAVGGFGFLENGPGGHGAAAGGESASTRRSFRHAGLEQGVRPHLTSAGGEQVGARAADVGDAAMTELDEMAHLSRTAGPSSTQTAGRCVDVGLDRA